MKHMHCIVYIYTNMFPLNTLFSKKKVGSELTNLISYKT